MDAKIKAAIEQAVESAGQSDTLAQRIAAWVQAVINGEGDLNDNGSTSLHLEFLYEAVQIPPTKEGRYQ